MIFFTITGIVVWACLAILVILYYSGVVDVGVEREERKDSD